MKLTQLSGREVLDSRGEPTIAVRAVIDNEYTAEAMVPAGASTGTHEAQELRDGDPQRYNGRGVVRAVANVDAEIFPILRDVDVADQRRVDTMMCELDGTPQKSRLGANAILGVSLAVAQVVARASGKELYHSLRQMFDVAGAGSHDPFILPTPMMNVINGGRHANNHFDVQEFMIVPQQEKFQERLRCGSEVFHALKKNIAAMHQSTAVGDEGGFAPDLPTHDDALQAMCDAVSDAGYTVGTDVALALDIAASEFYKNGMYHFEGGPRSGEDLLAQYHRWIEKYHIISIEDGAAEDDWENWKTQTRTLGHHAMVVGDDVFVTNVARLQKGIAEHVGNAIVIKINQIGTLSETIDAINCARHNKYNIVISHRSGETEDTTIADLAVAVNAPFIKTGSLSRSERIAKYNRLLAIEMQIEQ